MNKEQQQIIDDALKRYWKEGRKEVIVSFMPLLSRHYNREEYTNKCKTDTEFSEKWGLKIEERELHLGERQAILEKKGYGGLLNSNAKKYKSGKKLFEVIKQTCDDVNIPTKLITVTYNDKTIESYE